MVKDVEHYRETLTPLEEAFCANFVELLDAKAAALKAGYSATTARKTIFELMRRPGIQKRLSELRLEVIKKVGLEKRDILYRLARIAEKAEREGRYADALRALELLGKNLAMWTEKTDLTINPFATGEAPEDLARDTARLLRIAKLKPKDAPSNS